MIFHYNANSYTNKKKDTYQNPKHSRQSSVSEQQLPSLSAHDSGECSSSSNSTVDQFRNLDGYTRLGLPEEGILYRDTIDQLKTQDQITDHSHSPATVQLDTCSSPTTSLDHTIRSQTPFSTCSISSDNSLGLVFFGESGYDRSNHSQWSEDSDSRFSWSDDRYIDLDIYRNRDESSENHSLHLHSRNRIEDPYFRGSEKYGNRYFYDYGTIGNQKQSQKPQPPQESQRQRHRHQHSYDHEQVPDQEYLTRQPIKLPSIRHLITREEHEQRKRKIRRIARIFDRMSVALEHRRKEGNVIGSGLVHKEQGKDVSIWSKEYNIINEMTAPPPPIPARSRFRTVPSDTKALADHSDPVPTQFEVPSPVSGTSSDMKIITHRQSSLSLFKLPVDPPPPPPITPISPTFSSSIKESPSNDSTFGFGKRKSSKAVERDPLKVRDGVQARESTSGVYTPPTFPGAQGPRPSHFPTHVYTPTNFSLYPQGDSPASPSGSSSSSQSDSTAPPKTPLSPTGRLSKAVSSNMRRLSSGIVSLKDRTYYGTTGNTMHQRSATTPMLESGEYNYQGVLSNAYNSHETNLGGTGTGHSRESSSSWASWGDMIGNPKPRLSSTLYHTDTSYFPPVSSPIRQNAGLGMGMGMDSNDTGNKIETVVIDSSLDPVNFVDGQGPRELGPGSGSLAGKGKRKPVPRLGGGEEPQVHAM